MYRVSYLLRGLPLIDIKPANSVSTRTNCMTTTMTIRCFAGNRFHHLFRVDPRFRCGRLGSGFPAMCSSSGVLDTSSFSSVPGDTIFPHVVFDLSIGTTSIPSSILLSGLPFPGVSLCLSRLARNAVCMLGIACMLFAGRRGNRMERTVDDQSIETHTQIANDPAK